MTAALKERLESGAVTLALLDRRRQETGCSCIGVNLERIVIDRELRDLEGTVAVPTLCSIPDKQPVLLRRQSRRRSSFDTLV
jgi:hypothetical protein